MSTSTLTPKLVRAAALAAGIALSGVALAQDTGFYVSGSFGKSDMDISTTGAGALGVSSISTDETDTAWKLSLGYQFNRYLGAELSYVNFGDFELNGIFAGAPVAAKADLKAWTVAGVGTLPLGASRFSLFGKLGIAWGDSDGTASTGGVTVHSSGSGTDFFAGVGLRYDFNRNFGIQAEFEHYNFEDRVRLLSLGVRYKF